jgi:hypothetical protein
MPRDCANGLKVGDIITVYNRGFMKVVDIVKNYYNNAHYIPRFWDKKTKTYVQPVLGDEDWSTIYYRAVYTNAGKKFKHEQPRFSALANQCFKAEAVLNERINQAQQKLSKLYEIQSALSSEFTPIKKDSPTNVEPTRKIVNN